MVNRDSANVPPPTDEALEATLWRIREGLSRQVTHEGAARRARRRVWFGLVGAVVLFGAGITVGAWALPVIAGGTPVLKVVCYDSATSDAKSFAVTFDDESNAAAARQDPVDVCANARQDTSSETGIDNVVQNLIQQGHPCGVVNTTDGRAWSYKETDGTLSMTTGKFVTPLGAECAVVNNVTLPTAELPTAVACSVSDSQTNVYPGDPKQAAEICDSRGFTVLNSN